MKNLQLTKLGFLLFLVLLCGCSDSFVIDTPAEAGNSYESDVHVLNKFVDISEPVQKYYINPNKKSTVLSYITNSDLEELNAVNSLSASRYEKKSVPAEWKNFASYFFSYGGLCSDVYK